MYRKHLRGAGVEIRVHSRIEGTHAPVPDFPLCTPLELGSYEYRLGDRNGAI